MKLKQLRIHNFGKLKDRDIILEDGINVIYGPNESGKTTLHAFIKGMFYGIARQRGRAARSDMYTRYEPWDNSSFFAGVLRFESGGKVFRITRNFHKSNTKEELICETDGECLSVEQGDLAILIGNVSESAFNNTISVGQLKSRTDEGLYSELRNYMANYEGSNDGELDVAKALAILRRQKKEYESQKKVKSATQEAHKAELYARMEYIREEMSANQKQLGQVEVEQKRQRDSYYVPVAPQKVSPSRIEKQSGIQALPVALAILTVLAVVTGFMFHNLILSLLSGLVAVGCGFTAWILFVRAYRQRSKQNPTQNSKQNPVPIVDEGREVLKHLEWKRKQLQELQEEKTVQFENLQNDYREYEEQIRALDPNQEQIQSIQLAIEGIEQISSNMQKHLEKNLRHRISEILKELTSNRYLHVDITNEQQIGLHSLEHYLPLEMASKGTIEQVYFSLRMAAAELLCQEETMPVLLDDVFAMYDEERLAAALQWLAHNKEQVLIFTCQKRELELVQQLGVRINKIML